MKMICVIYVYALYKHILMQTDRPIISINDIPPCVSGWLFNILYKYNAKGGILTWQIGYDGNGNIERYISQLPSPSNNNPKIQYFTYQVNINNSGRSLSDQAFLEARSKYNDKINDGYSIDIESLAVVNSYDCMNAVVYEDHVQDIIWPTYVQAKLNGVRMVCCKTENGVVMKSRQKTVYTQFTEMSNELATFFDQLPDGVMLDGELYKHGMTFNDIISIVSTSTKIHDRVSELQYWIFDVKVPFTDFSFDERYSILVNGFNLYNSLLGLPKFFTIVGSVLANNHTDVKNILTKYLDDGYEGAMVKNIMTNDKDPVYRKHTIYESKRSKNILKYKLFNDEEGIIIGVEEAIGKDKGTAVFRVRDPRGNIIGLRMKATQKQRAIWFKNKEDILNKKVTYTYQVLSPDGVPIFPVGISIRDYE